MKKITLLFLLFVSSVLYCQSNGITYQALLLNPTGEKVPGVNNVNAPLANKDICLRFTILDAAFKTEYQETITIKTDEFGMVNTHIGSGRQSAGYASSFSDIYWDVNNKILKVAVDINGHCTTFIEISDQPLTYVPFAFSAKNAENVTGVVSVENGGTNAITVLGAKTNLGLENVDNIRDLDKPIGTATQLGLNLKENLLDKSIDVTNDGASDTKYPTVKAVKTYVDASSSLGASALASEISRAIAAENTIAGNLATETKRAELAEGLNITAIAIEKARAETAEEILTNNVSGEAKARAAADVVLADALAIEIGRASKAEGTLTSDLNNEATRATKAEDVLATNLNAAVADRVAADLLKEDKSDKSISIITDGGSDIKYPSVKSVKEYVDASATIGSEALNAEINRASTAEKSIAVDLATETKRAGLAEIANATAISDETKRAGLAETANATAISDETQRAENAENTLREDLASEKARAIAAEATKENSVNKSTDVSLADETNTKFPTELAVKTYVDANAALGSRALALEVVRATDAERANATAISDETKRAGLVENTLTDGLASEKARAIVAEATKENAVNKSTDVSLADETNTKFPTELAVKTFVTGQISTSNSANTAAIATVQSDVDANETVATTVYTTLQNNINTLTSTIGTNLTNTNTAIAAVQSDVDANETAANTAIALKENSANKSTDGTLADATNVKFPTELAVKTFVTGQIGISTTATNSAIAAVQFDVDANETAANTADTSLQNNINILSSTVGTNLTSTNTAIAAVQSDVDTNETAANTAITLKENSANKSTDGTLADATNTKFPTELAVKTFVTGQISTSNSTYTAAIAAVQSDVDANETAANTALALKENSDNKSTDGTLTDATNVKFPTELAVKTFVTGQISTSNSTNTAAIAAVQFDVDAIETAAITAIALKENSVNKSSDSTLADATNTKFPTELAVKTFVTGQIGTSNAANTAAVAAVQSDVDANETAANTADSILQNNINTLTSTVGTNLTNTNTAIAAVQSDVEANETDANTADTTLQNNINTLTSTVGTNLTNTNTSIAAVQSDVDANETTSNVADTTLQYNINTLTSTVVANQINTNTAIAAVQSDVDANATAITAETTRAGIAESANATAISNEASRATNAEVTIVANLETEITNRTNADFLKEDLTNKSTNITTDASSDTKYPSVKSVKDYVDNLVNIKTSTQGESNTIISTNEYPLSNYIDSMENQTVITNTAQTFKISSPFLLSSIDIKFQQMHVGGNISCKIYSGSAIGSGTLLGNTTFEASSTGFKNILFSSPINLSAGDYYFLLEASLGVDTRLSGSSAIDYKGGDAYQNTNVISGHDYYFTLNNQTNTSLINSLTEKEDTLNKSTSVITDASSDIKYPSVKSVKDYVDNAIDSATSGKFVDLTTAQTLAGAKTFSSDINVNGLNVGKGSGNKLSNTAFGLQSLGTTNTGDYNTAFGYRAMASNTSGTNNSAFGRLAFEKNVDGGNNTAIGTLALRNNSSGSYNVATGNQALDSNTTGSHNTAVGTSSLEYNIDGNNNTAIGRVSLYNNTSGHKNTGVGFQAGVDNVLGNNNSYLGYNSGLGITEGNNNTIIGANVTGLANDLSDNIILANGAGQIKAQHNGTNWTLSGGFTAGGITYPAVNGSNGQILTTDGAGNATWANGAIGVSQINDLQLQITQLQAQIASLNFANGLFSKAIIGTQSWSSTNLDVTTYRDGSPIPEVTDPAEWANLTTGAWCYYNNDSINKVPYGKLYNWYAINDPRGIAPLGYHVATETDFLALIAATGGENVSGWALKEIGSAHWSENYREGSTNSSGFTAVAGGFRSSSGNFQAFGRLAAFHLSDILQSNGIFSPRYKLMRAEDGLVFTDWIGFSPNNGFSVRFVKD